MMANIRILRVLLLFSFLSCSQPKKQYGPDDYLYRVTDTSTRYEQFGYKDKDGDIAIPFGKYTWAYTDTIKTIGFVLMKGGGWAINKNDEKLFKVFPSPNNGPDEVSEGLFRILDEDGLIGFANMDGKVTVSPRFTQVSSFRDGRAIFCQGCKVGSYLKFYDENARGELLQIIGRLQDTVIIQRKVRYGMINTKGDTVLRPLYDRIDDFKDSIALVYKDGRAFYIDRRGNEVAYDPKRHPNQKPLDPHISKRIKYIDSWEIVNADGTYDAKGGVREIVRGMGSEAEFLKPYGPNGPSYAEGDVLYYKKKD